MKVKIKKLNKKAIIPAYAKEGDAGLDFTAINKTEIDFQGKLIKTIYDTGLAVEIPSGYVGLLFPRSSVHKTNQTLANCVGVIDSGYRGEIKFVFKTIENSGTSYNIGDRIGQLIILPYSQIEFVEDELSESERGANGFGSTNK